MALYPSPRNVHPGPCPLSLSFSFRFLLFSLPQPYLFTASSLCLLSLPPALWRSILMAVSKKDVLSGKSGSFDGTDTEWQQLVFDALFSLGSQDITLSAQINKSKDKISVSLSMMRIDTGHCTKG